jgi:HlyD family secretion protein
MRTALRIALVVAAVAAVGVALKLTVLAPDVVEVRTAAAERGVVEETITNTRAGTVKVRLRARLSPQVGGLVVALPHREGATVAAGDLLLALDSRVQRADVELAERSVAASEAQAAEVCLMEELAGKDLARAEALMREGLTSDQVLDTRASERDRSRAACLAAQAATDQARAALALARVQLDLSELRAPFAGTVADLSTEVGEWITPSPPGVPIPPVIDLLDPTSLYVSAPIDEVDGERIVVGQEARVTVDSRRGVSFAASVARVAPYVLDALEQNRTVEVEVAFADVAALAGVLPGTSADVEIIVDRREGVLRVPTAAVAEGGEVLVLEGQRLVSHTIEVGLKNWQFAELRGGLAEGSRVVVSRGSTEVKAGALARERDGER